MRNNCSVPRTGALNHSTSYLGLADLKDPKMGAQVDDSFAGIVEDELELVKR